MVRVGVVGATGYTGAELVRILSGHPGVELSVLTSESYAGLEYSKVYPAMRKKVDIACEPLDPHRVAKAAEVIFTALPHSKSMACVPLLMETGSKVIDMSADFRLKERKIYEQWYAPHTAADLLQSSAYGLPELHRGEISRAKLVAVPGCYPTSAILGVAPLAKAGLLGEDPVIVNSASGVTGAGRSLELGSLFCEVNEGMKAYKVAQHRHTPEMEQEISSLAGREVRVVFVPHLLPLSRGILSTIYLGLKESRSEEYLWMLYSKFYESEPFVRVLAPGQFPNLRDVRGSNFCDIGLRVDSRSGKVIVLVAIDNLVKGASGQAVQCMNIMMGFQEMEGLLGPPLFL
ncbi:MAG: N-acetyl-gamma-glutamyl-phosphate reductase [bacterium]